MATARVVVVNGPRQAGKTTLLRAMHRATGGTFVTLDLPADLRAARLDPTSFARDLPKPLYIDEVQRGGDPLLLAIKAQVDLDPSPGRFVLAGSTRFLTVPTLSESLAGRARIVDLGPMTQAELRGLPPESWIDAAFRGRCPDVPNPPTRADYARMIVAGGLPSFARLDDERARAELLEDYARTVTLRDAREIARIRKADDLLRLLRLLAARTANELVITDLARDAGLDRETTSTYLALLETVYLSAPIPAWSRNITTKIKHRPKVHLVDTGLAAALVGAGSARLALPTEPGFGPLLESFVLGELSRAATWAELGVAVHHQRDRDGHEVDIVLEARDGRVVAVEVKASVDVRDEDLRGLRRLRDRLGDAFVLGVVASCGDRTRSLGDRLLAMPIAGLWGTTMV